MSRVVSIDRSAAAFVRAYLAVFLFALLAACQQADELLPLPEPALEFLIAIHPIGVDHHPTFHRFSGDVKFANVGFFQGGVVGIWTRSDNHPVTPNTGKGEAVLHEADAAKHSLFDNPLLGDQCVFNASGKEFVEGHVGSGEAASDAYRGSGWLRHAEAMWRSLANVNGGPFASVRRCR